MTTARAMTQAQLPPDGGGGRLRPFAREAVLQAMRPPRSAPLEGMTGWQGVIDSLRVPDHPPLAAALTRALAFGLASPILLRWAVLSSRLEEVLSARPDRSLALVAAERWLREGREEDRYEAYRLATAEDFETPATLAALAAFLAGPSIAPQGAPVSAPSPKVASAAATNVLTVVAATSALGLDGYARVNEIGVDLAYGGDGVEGARRALAWTAPAPGKTR